MLSVIDVHNVVNNNIYRSVNMSIENFENIKKGTELLVNNGLGVCTAFAMESIKQGKGFKKFLLVDMKASEIGFFDEMGSRFRYPSY